MVYVKTATSPPREGEPAGTRKREEGGRGRERGREREEGRERERG